MASRELRETAATELLEKIRKLNAEYSDPSSIKSLAEAYAIVVGAAPSLAGKQMSRS